MANTIAPFGAIDQMHFGGSQRTEELQVAWVASSDVTPIFYGDIVQPATPVSTALLTTGYGNYITQGCSIQSSNQSGTGWAGVFRGCEFFNPTIARMQFSRYWPGSGVAGTSSNTGDIKCFIQADASYRFIIQGSSQNIIGSSQVGQLFSVAVNGAAGTPSSAGGNTTTGNSGMSLASSTPLTPTSTTPAPFALVDFYSNWAPGLLPGQTPGSGTGQFVNGADNASVGQYLIVKPWFWSNNGP